MHDLTCMLLTYNEESNLDRTLSSIAWVNKIIVIDSFSNDRTLEIARAYPQVEIHQRTFDSFANQCNYGLGLITTEWVLSLDADYVVSPELANEICALPNSSSYDGYFASFKYCVNGYPLHGTLYPPRQILYRRAKASYADDGHGHSVRVDGCSGQLLGKVWHDDRKPLARWLKSQDRYMRLEAQKLCTTPTDMLNLADRIRKNTLLAPILVFLYCLIIQRGILDGWRGQHYASQRALAETLLALRVIEYRYMQKQMS